ncbi:hypothetical protein [Burkholderia vietnamiensis]|uniref:hypothetical protein n=1 Tax=Burkholderia vietnamiensis TaxID=60552 RepID=UPI001CF59F26|nr:hypothetical protein [Burkholderia vietnamiensis]MCA8287570.1 hypothetical protein [Burkholderia vietnamiensis]
MNLEEAITLLKGDFGKELLHNARNYAIPLAWGIEESGEWTILSNGTAFILDCGQGPFLVTAAHVYEGYLEAREEHAALRCQLGMLEFRLEQRLICTLGQTVLDIATFKIEPDEIAALNKQICHGPADWPPRNAAEGNAVFFGGFPGVERRQIAEDTINQGFYVALTPVSSSSERQFGCAFERENWIDTLGHGIPAEDYDLGGVSGGPMLLLNESESGIFSWHIIGVVYNATNALGEIVLAHHVSSIKADGSLIAPAR